MKTYLLFLIVLVFSSLYGQTQITNSNTLNAPATNSIESIPLVEDEKLELKEVTKTTSTNQKAQALLGLNHVKSTLKWNRTTRSFSIEDQAKINQYVGVLYRENPNSFEYNYWKFYASSYDVSQLKYIEKAAKIQATNLDVQQQLAVVYSLLSKKKEALAAIDKLMKGGMLSMVQIDYSSDLLESVAQNGVLIVHSFEDAFACYYVQHKLNLRQDVFVLPLEYLRSATFRKQVTEKGLFLPNLTLINTNYFKQLIEINAKYSFFLSFTLPKEYLSTINLTELKTVGLTFTNARTYKDESVCSTFNLNLWDHVFSKKVLQSKDYNYDKNLGANYLPLILSLTKQYPNREDLSKELKQIALLTNKKQVLK
jgi:hypothetical protein